MKTFPKPLTTEEEKEYLKRYRKGDQTARNVLIERNLRLVAHIVKKYQSSGEDTEDLISVGTIGLIKAVMTFDAAKGSRLPLMQPGALIMLYYRSGRNGLAGGETDAF